MIVPKSYTWLSNNKIYKNNIHNNSILFNNVSNTWKTIQQLSKMKMWHNFCIIKKEFCVIPISFIYILIIRNFIALVSWERGKYFANLISLEMNTCCIQMLNTLILHLLSVTCMFWQLMATILNQIFILCKIEIRFYLIA